MPSPFPAIYNDKMYNQGSLPFSLENRAFRYGDGLFETILMRKNKPVFWEAHMDRMENGMDILGFDFRKGEWRKKMKAAMRRLTGALGPCPLAKLRLFVFRADGGAYRPQSDLPEYIAMVVPVEATGATRPLNIGVYDAIALSYSPLSAVKKLSAIHYVLAARHAHLHGWDDALLRAPDGSLAESTVSNLFLLREGALLTPPLSSGCLPGVTRRMLIEAAAVRGIPLEIQPVTEAMIDTAEGLFLTNALRGPQPVGSVAGIKEFSYQESPLIKTLSKTLIEMQNDRS